MTPLMNRKGLKIIAVYLALSLLLECFYPTVALALTNGPSQPEMESFEPIGTTEMVDPFSGDFNYNIPLMTVPGPNGGYPLNLSYHAGISMEQEASWVGLGWNINVGEISRQLRGLPDDFNGDIVEKTTYMRPNRTVTLGANGSAEIVSADFKKKGVKPPGFSSASASISLTWNSYKGLGIGWGQSVNVAGKSGSFSKGLNMNYNSLSGETTLSPSLTYLSKMKKSNQFGISLSYGSVEGIKSLTFNTSKENKTGKNGTDRKYKDKEGEEHNQTSTRSSAAGVSFSSSSFVPYSDMPMGGFSVATEFKFGPDMLFVHPYFGGSAFYSQNKISSNYIQMPAYGYLNSQERDGTRDQGHALMDFNRDKDVDLVKDIPAMPAPVFTNDIFYAKGQGVGGAFRAYRSDIGILQDPVVKSNNVGGSITVEVGIGNPVKVGSDVTGTYAKGYQGPWRDPGTWSMLHSGGKYQFKHKQTAKPLFEPSYFRNAADMTSNYNEANTTPQGTGVPLGINMNFGLNISDFTHPDLQEIDQPLADVFVTHTGSLGDGELKERPSRSQAMSYKTNSELNSGPGYHSNFSNRTIFKLGAYPSKDPNSATNPPPSNPQYSALNGSHIGEITVLNPDGNRYIYGIPAYNNASKEVSFSVEGKSTENAIGFDGKIVNYSSRDASSRNNKGDDHFYTSKSLPRYAHSYLLTAIVSPDYVDLKDDGLTEDDYGYYVKFNYSKLDNDYKWRSPFIQANYMEGSNNHPMDDKAGYMYGEKEIWYLTSIETKTHVAEFTLSARRDGYGVNNENNGSNAAIATGATAILDDDNNDHHALQKIDRIDLYSKSDPGYKTTSGPTPIKTIHFRYTYDLCGKVSNNNGVPQFNPEAPGTNINTHRGKLTLKKVWFTYLKNNKGELSPYVFDYDEAFPNRNQDFSTLQMNGWGNYKRPNPGPQYRFDPEDPYVNQNNDKVNNPTVEDDRNDDASMWCLRKIILPSGGRIMVDYESDDYAYVQDHRAMQMAKIVSTARRDNSGNMVLSNDGSLTGENDFLAFELDNQNMGDADVAEYIKGIDKVYFKVYLYLKKEMVLSSDVYDYVSGYAPVDQGAAGTHYGVFIPTGYNRKVGYLKLGRVNVHDAPALAGLDHTNAIRKAGWQYLKLNRTDLLYPSTNNNLGDNPAASALLQLAASTIGYFTSNIQLFTGYYNFCIMNGYCKKMNPSGEHPSFIRLNSPDYIKYGGGHRVKEIKVFDTWAGSGKENKYGQHFTYRLEDGKSSGVAEYEPMIGGDEIALRKPITYSSDYKYVKHEDLYLEEPYCESYYPAASVGYSRVVISGIQHKDDQIPPQAVTSGVQGVTVHEFYTAKDFPVIVTPSTLTQKKFTPDITVPFIGRVSFENYGYSQTFTVETNNMHGKEKSIATYAYSADSTLAGAVPVTKSEYIYKTDVPYSPNSTNHLNNEVEVLYDDAQYKLSNLGLTKEFFLDMRERSNVSMSIGLQCNVEVAYVLPFPVVTIIPSIDYSEGLNKMVVGMNLISRNGILIETRQFSEGSMASTTNLMFDAATGSPLLTSLTNDFDEPVYTYKYAGHWAYEKGIGAAYKNLGATFEIKNIAGGNCTFSTSINTSIFTKGDELALVNITSPHPVNYGVAERYWVKDIAWNGIEIVDINGNHPQPVSNNVILATITRSGRRNQLVATNGTIVSLDNPIKGDYVPLFEAFNNWVLAHPGIIPGAPIVLYLNYIDIDGQHRAPDIVKNGNILKFDYAWTGIPPNSCPTDCHRGISFTLPTSILSATDYYLIRKGNKYYAVLNNGTGNQHEIIPDNPCCISYGVKDVLHADATELSDEWILPDTYTDVDANSCIKDIPLYVNNPYQSGQKGIWRVKRNNVYQIDRKQLNPTYIGVDGVYEKFNYFDWTTPAIPNQNKNWTWTSEITRYNPVGFETENRDQLGIYSAALYGYKNSVQTAIAQNASYFETAFDGFEDYCGDTYSKGHGHMKLEGMPGNILPVLTSKNSHSGRCSIVYPGGGSTSLVFDNYSKTYPYFRPEPGKKYLFSFWVSGTSNVSATITGNVTNASSQTVTQDIEGWKKIDMTFEAKSPQGSNAYPQVIFSIKSGSQVFVDDVRIHPFKSSIKTYVYDPVTLKFVAELDNQNFATFYNYDEEGILVQVKKETERGIYTIKTTRSNTQYKTSLMK